jgi:hypothetical protein
MCSWCIKSSGLQATRDKDETQNGERRSRGSHRCAYQRWRRTEVARFRGQRRRRRFGQAQGRRSGGGPTSGRGRAARLRLTGREAAFIGAGPEAFLGVHTQDRPAAGVWPQRRPLAWPDGPRRAWPSDWRARVKVG